MKINFDQETQDWLIATANGEDVSAAAYAVAIVRSVMKYRKSKSTNNQEAYEEPTNNI